MAFASDQKFGALERFAKCGGVIKFTLFEDAEGALAEQRRLIADHFRRLGVEVDSGDESFLAETKPAKYDRDAFLGDWYEAKKGKLISVGSWRTEDGETLESPTLEALDRVTIKAGGFSPPELGARGQFAYAFFQTPYRLRGKGAQIQATFDGLWATFSPPGTECEYYDWSLPDLEQHFVPYYRDGAEWWGTFLFTVHDSTLRRLWVMSASTTD